MVTCWWHFFFFLFTRVKNDDKLDCLVQRSTVGHSVHRKRQPLRFRQLGTGGTQDGNLSGSCQSRNRNHRDPFLQTLHSSYTNNVSPGSVPLHMNRTRLRERKREGKKRFLCGQSMRSEQLYNCTNKKEQLPEISPPSTYSKPEMTDNPVRRSGSFITMASAHHVLNILLVIFLAHIYSRCRGIVQVLCS